MDRVQRITGHTADTQHLVDGDLAAALEGPQALHGRLTERGLTTMTRCYRALLDRAWQERSNAARDAVRRAAAIEAENERRQVRRGGNR